MKPVAADRLLLNFVQLHHLAMATIDFSSGSSVDCVAGFVGCLVVALVAATVVLKFGAAVVALQRQVEWPISSSM